MRHSPVALSIVFLCACPPNGGGTGEEGTATVGTDTTVTGTTTGATTTTETTGTETTGLGVGECDADPDCGPNQYCVDAPDGECACDPGLVLCADECVDITSSAVNCGRCFRVCPPSGPLCSGGLCINEDPGPPGPFVEPARQLSPGDPTNECLIANENKPERSIVETGPGNAVYFSAVQGLDVPPGSPIESGFNTWADDMNIWDTSDPALRLTPSTVENVFADPWSTTHGGTGLDYVSYILLDGTGGSCVGVAATNSTLIQANNWPSPLACVEDFTPGPTPAITDGPVIVSDLGARAIHVAYVLVGTGANEGFELLRFAPCLSGVPSTENADCPLLWRAGAGAGLPVQVRDHPNVAVNPCTHHPIALFRTATEEVHYMFLDSKREIVADHTADQNAPMEANSNCQGGVPCPDVQEGGEICKCGGVSAASCAEGAGCWDLAPRVHAATKFSAADGCRLYLAYDVSFESTTDNETYMRSRLKVIDINDEENPFEVGVGTLDSSADDATHNDFNAAVVSDFFSDGVGFFFYRQAPNDPCITTYTGSTSADAGASFNDAGDLSAAPFPTMRFAFTEGMGHYVEGTRFTEPGWLLATWSQPVVTAASCVDCQSVDYSLAVMAARVRP